MRLGLKFGIVFIISLLMGAQPIKNSDLFQLTKSLVKNRNTLQKYQLRLLTNNKTIYGPDLVGITRPTDLKMILSFNTFVTDLDIDINRVEIYGEENTFLHAVDYPEPLKLKKRQSINFFFTIDVGLKLENSIR